MCIKMKFIIVDNDQLAGEIERLALEIWTEHYTPIIGEAQVAFMLNRFQTAEAVMHQIQKEGYQYYFLQDSNQRFAGYLAFVLKDGSVFISKFYVLAEYRGQGYGRAACCFIEDAARAHGASRLFLTVNKNNSRSIAVYERLGFRIAEPVCVDIGGGFVMDDYRMEKKID